jgi:hypothetical protein
MKYLITFLVGYPFGFMFLSLIHPSVRDPGWLASILSGAGLLLIADGVLFPFLYIATLKVKQIWTSFRNR